jgi:PAS domain S-box-containing protein
MSVSDVRRNEAPAAGEGGPGLVVGGTRIDRILFWLAPAAAIVALYLVSRANYVLFHSLVEVSRVVVLFGVFVIAWHSRRWSNETYIVFIGIAFLNVGFLELLHALAYQGMGVFDDHDANLPTQLWIAVRYLESTSLIVAPFLSGRRIHGGVVFVLYAAITAALTAAIFSGVFPDCFVTGQGQTPFKIVSEYVIGALFAGAMVAIIARRLLDTGIRALMLACLVTTIAAEVAFAQYVNVYGPANQIGHLLLLLSTYFLYRAVLVSGIVNPFSLLFQNLKDSQERYARLADATREGVLICDKGRIVEVNAGFRAMFGYSDAELEELPLGDLFAGEERRTALAMFDEPCAAVRQTLARRRDGSVFPVELSGGVLSHGGRDLRVAQIRDLTEEKRNEEERRILQAEVRQASRLSEIGRVAAALAHELNQPLTAVTSYVGACRRLLAAGKFGEAERGKLAEVMGLAGAQAMRAAEIIRHVREFIGTGESERTIEDAAQVVREAATLALAAARHNAVVLTTDFADVGRVLVNKVQIQQVVINLVSNALEAMETGTRRELEIVLAAQADQVTVSVADTGPGLDPEIAERVFKPFASTKVRGMGIGLSVCREIVESHHGKIWFETNPSGGATFRFTLPQLRGDVAA